MTYNTVGKSIPTYLINSNTYDVVVTNLQGDYIYVNEHFKARFSFLTDDFIGKPSSTTFHPDDLPKAEEAVIKCFNNPQEPVNVQLRKPLKTSHGYYWTQWEFSLYLDEDNQPAGIFCIGYDISETKHNIDELKLSHIKLSKVIESVPHPLLLLNSENEIKFVNTEFELIFEYKLSEIVNKSLGTLLDSKNQEDYLEMLDNYKLHHDNALIYNQFLYVKTKTKTSKYIGISINTYQGHDNERNIVLILQDLTAFKKNQDIIINQNKALRKIAQKYSHEIRRPVTNIKSLSELIDLNLGYIQNLEVFKFLKESVDEIDEITRKVVEEANKNEYNSNIKSEKRNLF